MTPEQIAAEREGVVGSAKGWIGTPYHHMGTVRGVGADCVTFLRGAFLDARIGLDIPTLDYYPEDWHLHRDAERYMAGLIAYCTEMPHVNDRRPLPGDILLFKFARAYAHGALVVDYPNLLHALKPKGVERVDLFQSQRLTITSEGDDIGKPRPLKVFTLTRWVT